MLDVAVRWMRGRKVGRRIEEGIRAGIGLHREQWLIEEMPLGEPSLRSLAAKIAGWCQETIAGTRRPHGVDQLALAVACAHPGGEALAAASFGLFRPADYYRADGVADELSRFVIGLTGADFANDTEPVRFAAALFSWGDLARATVFASES